VVGAVDGNRIGSDVDPRWTLDPARADEAYPDALPATRHAFRNTLARSFMHRNLWLNDPDCVMLRTTQTDLDPAGVRTWAETVAVSGGMVLVSDDLALLDDTSRALLHEVIAIGRQVDAEAMAGAPPVCDDLLDASPGRLRSARHSLVVDTTTGHGELTAR
jgi:alpha-galactosidase